MSEWGPAEWALFFGSAATFLGALTAAVLQIIKAVKENTRVTLDAAATNIMDREAKAAQTLDALKPIATQVNDIHAGTGTGTGVTVNVPPPAPPPAA